MNRDQIATLLPHRGVFALLDRVVEVEAGKSAVAEVDVSADAFWVSGHFPGFPVMPGVLITEALAQTAGVVYATDPQAEPGAKVYLLGVDGMRYRAPVRPGHVLRLQVSKVSERRRMWKFEGEAYVGATRVANGSLLATIAPTD